VTNDLHYVDANDASSHDVLLCVQTGKQLETPKRMKFDSNVFSGWDATRRREARLCLILLRAIVLDAP